MKAPSWLRAETILTSWQSSFVSPRNPYHFANHRSVLGADSGEVAVVALEVAVPQEEELLQPPAAEEPVLLGLGLDAVVDGSWHAGPRVAAEEVRRHTVDAVPEVVAVAVLEQEP